MLSPSRWAGGMCSNRLTGQSKDSDATDELKMPLTRPKRHSKGSDATDEVKGRNSRLAGKEGEGQGSVSLSLSLSLSL